MIRRCLLFLSLALLLTLLRPVEPAQADGLQIDQEPSAPLRDDGTLCVSRLVWRDWLACPPYGPATTAARVANIRLPDPLPELAVTPVDESENNSTPLTYAQIIQDNTPVYNHPIEAIHSFPPKRHLGVGFVWVSVQGETTFEDRSFYQINPGEYVSAEALSLYRPSAFQGVALAAQPERPFAWILTAVRPLRTPGGEVNLDAPVYGRYELVQIFATEHVNGQVWYLISPDQWIVQTTVAKVERTPAPAGVGAGTAWIDVNLFEQTLAAYVGDRMVYATLVSSGLPGWNTLPGLFQVWHRVESGKMSGAHKRPDYYFLEDVPWALYFNQAIALHGAYWHNSFGYRHSHGCVNLAPLDAQWLFNWVPDAAWVQVRSGQELASN